MKTNYVFGKTKLFTINRKAIKSFLYANLLKVTILLVLFLTSNSAFSQNTILLDPHFDQALINQGYDSGPIDGVFPTNNSIILADTNGCSSNTTVTIYEPLGDTLVSDSTILSIKEELDISLYPNLSYGMLNIKSNFDYYNIQRIDLFNSPSTIYSSRIDTNNIAFNKRVVLE